MNTNDFYKELMSEYSFDYEKIRKAAMGKSVQAKKSRLKTIQMQRCLAKTVRRSRKAVQSQRAMKQKLFLRLLPQWIQRKLCLLYTSDAADE